MRIVGFGPGEPPRSRSRTGTVGGLPPLRPPTEPFAPDALGREADALSPVVVGPPTPPRRRERIRIAIVDEHEIFRRGLVACVGEDAEIEIRACEATVPAGLDRIGEVDLALVSPAVARDERIPVPIVVFTDAPGAPLTLAAGNVLRGLLPRGTVTETQILAGLRAAAAGLQVGPPAAPLGELGQVDERALRVLALLADGRSTSEIAAALAYSERTIKSVISGLEGPLHARGRSQLVAQAIRRGLI